MRINVYFINSILLLGSIFWVLKTNSIKVTIPGRRRNYNINTLLFSIFWWILLSLEYGLRGAFTSDYNNYENWFLLFQDYSIKNAFNYKNVEKGYAVLNALVGYFSNDYHVFVFVIGFISISLFMIAIWKNTSNPVVPIMIFVASGFFYGGWNLSAQFLSAAIFSLAIKHIYNRNFIKFLCLVIAASLIHKSAIIMIPLYFALIHNFTIKMWRRMINFSIVVCIAATPFIGIVSSKASRLLYGELYADTVENGYPWTYIIKCVSLVIIIVIFSRCFDFENLADRITYLGSIIYGISILWSYSNPLIQRFSYFFVLFPMIAFSKIYERKRNTTLLSLVLSVYFFVMQIGWFSSEYYTFI